MPISSELELTIAFSQELGEVISKKFIDNIKKYSGDKFQRGICNSNRLFLSFKGEEELSGFTSALIKKISEFSREYRIGVRDYYLPSYELSFENDLIGKLIIPHTETVLGNGKICKIVFKDLEKELLRSGAVKRVMKLIEQKTREKSWKLSYKNDLKPRESKNPYEEVELRGLARKGLAKDQYFYLPKGAREISKLKNGLLEKLSHHNLKEFFPLDQVLFSTIENEKIIEFIPIEALEKIVCETEERQRIYESYFVTGAMESLKATRRGFIYNEIPFNLYKAMEKRKVKKNHFFYCLSGMKILVTVFDTEENYPAVKQEIIAEMREIIESLGLNYRIISRIANGEFIKFEAYLPHNKTWLPLAELFFSENIYTIPFQISGKSAQANINLENIFLAKIAQGFFDNSDSKEELPVKSIDSIEEMPARDLQE